MKHLQTIKLLYKEPRASNGVDLIVGLDAPEALQPLEIIAQRDGDSFAI